MYPELKNRVVLITGGGSGLGLSTAEAFAAAGSRVVINDLDGALAEQCAGGLGTDHLGLAGDVSREDDVDTVVGTTLEQFGRIDVLVNSAGMADTFQPTVDQDLEHWQRLIDVHLTGTYLVTKKAGKAMLDQRQGAVINLSSIAGIVGLARRNAYSAAKAGIGMLTRNLACEWAASGVRVNAVAPAYMLTPLLQNLLDEGKVDVERIQRRTPMGRLGRPEDVADSILFLASDRAAYITGVTLPVDGGYTAFGAPSDAHEGPWEQ